MPRACEDEVRAFRERHAAGVGYAAIAAELAALGFPPRPANYLRVMAGRLGLQPRVRRPRPPRKGRRVARVRPLTTWPPDLDPVGVLRLARFLAARLCPRWLHDDAAADAALAMLTALPGYDPGRGVPVKPYLLLVGRRALLRFRSLAARRGVTQGRPAWAPGGPWDAPDPADRLAAVDAADECRALLPALPPRERAAVRWHAADGEPIGVVADRLGVTPDHAHRVVRSGLNRLRAMA